MIESQEERIERLVAENTDFPAVVVAAARLLLATRGRSSTQPDGIYREYWPTICLVWTLEDRNVEVEVSATDYEYSGRNEAPLDIRHFPHEGGSIVADGLLNLLPA